MSDTVKRYTTSTNYCMIDETGKRGAFNETEFVLADDYTRDTKALEARCVALESRPTIAKFNALQEECDGRLTVHQRQVVQAAKQAKTIERLRDAIHTACHCGAQDKAEMDEINAALEAGAKDSLPPATIWKDRHGKLVAENKRLEQVIDQVQKALEAGEWGYNVLRILDTALEDAHE